jgi:hypothetical protein
MDVSNLYLSYLSLFNTFICTILSFIIRISDFSSKIAIYKSYIDECNNVLCNYVNLKLLFDDDKKFKAYNQLLDDYKNIIKLSGDINNFKIHNDNNINEIFNDIDINIDDLNVLFGDILNINYFKIKNINKNKINTLKRKKTLSNQCTPNNSDQNSDKIIINDRDISKSDNREPKNNNFKYIDDDNHNTKIDIYKTVGNSI